MGVNDKDFIKGNWGKMPLNDIANSLSLGLLELLEIAYELNLQSIKTPELRRGWTKSEDEFLTKYADRLRIPEACNLLYRSRYATYQRVKFLNLQQMIGK